MCNWNKGLMKMKSLQNHTPKILLLISIATFLAVFIGMQPLAQDLHYHSFANDNSVFGIANGWNVLSNIGFILCGIFGFQLIVKHNIKSIIIWALFIGIFLTGLGSAYYHYHPNNQTLVWDRLPMTIVFTAFFAQLYSWYFSEKTAFYIWIASLVIGIFSVSYWQYTESIGKGDLRLYAIVQFLPMLLILAILFIHSNKNSFLWKPLSMVIIWYIIAKFLEHYDQELFILTNTLSGHPFKHIAASIATFYIVLMVKKQAISEKEYLNI